MRMSSEFPNDAAYQKYLAERDGQRNGLLRVLQLGKREIKVGHRTKLTPEGKGRFVELSYPQVSRRLAELDKLGGKIENPSVLPENVARVYEERGRRW